MRHQVSGTSPSCAKCAKSAKSPSLHDAPQVARLVLAAAQGVRTPASLGDRIRVAAIGSHRCFDMVAMALSRS